MTARPPRRVSVQDYLAMEEASASRNELVDGVIVAMAGNRYTHVQIVRNLVAELDARLRGKSCQVLGSDLKVKVALTESYFYPDLVGICGPPISDAPSQVTILNPTLIIEVLSPSTEAFDRGKKFLHYQQIPTLREYILLSQIEPVVESYIREEHSAWRYTTISGLDSVAAFASIDCTVPLSDIYRDVEFKDESIE
jgi:Uma2 family endonuclease